MVQMNVFFFWIFYYCSLKLFSKFWLYKKCTLTFKLKHIEPSGFCYFKEYKNAITANWTFFDLRCFFYKIQEIMFASLVAYHFYLPLC